MSSAPVLQLAAAAIRTNCANCCEKKLQVLSTLSLHIHLLRNLELENLSEIKRKRKRALQNGHRVGWNMTKPIFSTVNVIDGSSIGVIKEPDVA